jgi:hypothetical protein
MFGLIGINGFRNSGGQPIAYPASRIAVITSNVDGA